MRNHYFNISLMDADGRCRSAVITSAHQRVTARDIAGVYMELDLGESTIVVAVSHMGYMTAEEYTTGAVPSAFRIPWIGVGCCIIPFIILGLVVWLTR